MKKNGTPRAGSGKAFAAVPSFFLFLFHCNDGRNKMDTSALFKISYGLFVLTAKGKDGRESGCIINTAMQVTSNPLQVCFTVNKANYTHDLVLESGSFTLSVLSEKASFDTFKRFGFQSGRDVDKFAGFEDSFRRGANGLPYITAGTNAWISGEVVQHYDVGTHHLFVARVTDMAVLDDKTPSATYTYYQEHIKPKPQSAPKPGAKTKTVWRCRICGYIYEGETLTPDFVCPICKHGASDFEKVEVEA